ncbi:MAG: TldD/PmbA family protein [Anaerolineae bacterium]|nr:TldD/PmbA family protein [Anaerolineae bacterium]
MRELADLALDTAHARGATYSDVRIVQRRTQQIATRNGVVLNASDAQEQGFGVRVIAGGAWGFSSSSRLSRQEVERVAAEAVEIARASATVGKEPVDLGPPEVHVDSYRTPLQIDPFTIPLEEKMSLLLAADAAMQRVKGINVARASAVSWQENKTFASSEGSWIEQELWEVGGGIVAYAMGNGEMQQRSYPNSFARDQRTGGWEIIQEMDLPGNGERVASEAVALLTADPCPSQVTTLILGPTQLALQIHESCGHPTELDRVFGSEAAYAGTSFLTPDKLNELRYGSPIVNLTADATIPGGLGTFGYDDEGVPAQRVPLVRAGIFVGYLSSRETMVQLAKTKGQDPAAARSGGAMRAAGWNRIPLVRMTNVSLEPGEWTLEDLVADTDAGIYMEMNRSWSIDDKRLNFQFGTEVAREIRNGKMGRLLKNALYTGMTPQFWGACDAICNADHWRVWGTPNCGKGQPSQVAHTGHGAAPARFRNIQIGSKL